jgi:hypothetical protein
MDPQNILRYAIPREVIEIAEVAAHMIEPPPKPFILFHHIIVEKNIQQIIDSINSTIQQINEKEYFSGIMQFSIYDVTWNGYFTYKDRKTDFHIRIYKNSNGIPGYIIEFQHMYHEDDSLLYYKLVNRFKLEFMCIETRSIDPLIIDNCSFFEDITEG